MIIHVLPIFRSDDILQNQLSSDITEHLRESLHSSNKLGELDFISQDFRGTTQGETTFTLKSGLGYIQSIDKVSSGNS